MFLVYFCVSGASGHFLDWLDSSVFWKDCENVFVIEVTINNNWPFCFRKELFLKSFHSLNIFFVWDILVFNIFCHTQCKLLIVFIFRFLSIPKGFSYLNERGYVAKQLEKWHKVTFCWIRFNLYVILRDGFVNLEDLWHHQYFETKDVKYLNFTWSLKFYIIVFIFILF